MLLIKLRVGRDLSDLSSRLIYSTLFFKVKKLELNNKFLCNFFEIGLIIKLITGFVVKINNKMIGLKYRDLIFNSKTLARVREGYIRVNY